MQGRRRGRATRQHERAQRLQLGIHLVDFFFQAVHLGLDNPQGFPFGLLAGLRRAEVSTEVKKVVLDAPEHRVEDRIRGRGRQSHHADSSIGFINRAIGFDAQVVFRTAFARPQSRCALITGARVNTIENDQCFLSSAAQPEHAHNDQNGDELQSHAPAHQHL